MEPPRRAAKGGQAMTDDIMTRVREWLASCVRVATENGAPEEADLEAAALAFIDGEPLRQAKALEAVRDENTSLLGALENDAARLAAAREEQREACALDAEERVGCASTYDEIRSVPLDATPLADEIAALRARVEELEAEQEARDDVMTATQRLKFWQDNPHACPIHFGARTACGQCFDSVSQQLANIRVEHAATLKDLRAAEAERDALRAQLLSERERLERWLTAPDGKQYERGTVQAVFDECDALRAQQVDLLDAMDKAKP